MTDRIFVTAIIMIVCAFAFYGCAAFTPGPGPDAPSVCDSAPKGQVSAICTLADKMGTTPETIARGVKIANGVAIIQSYYKAAEAKAFLAEVRGEVAKYRKSGAVYTLDQAFEYAQKKWQLLTPEVRPLINVINPVDLEKYGVKLTLCDYDYELILAGLDEQIDFVEPFIN